MVMFCIVINGENVSKERLAEKVTLHKSLKSQAGWPGVGRAHQDSR